MLLPLSENILDHILTQLVNLELEIPERQNCFWILAYLIQNKKMKNFSKLLPLLEKTIAESGLIQSSSLKLMKMINEIEPLILNDSLLYHLISAYQLQNNSESINLIIDLVIHNQECIQGIYDFELEEILWKNLNHPLFSDYKYDLASFLSSMTRDASKAGLLIDYIEESLCGFGNYRKAIHALKHLSHFKGVFCLSGNVIKIIFNKIGEASHKDTHLDCIFLITESITTIRDPQKTAFSFF